MKNETYLWSSYDKGELFAQSWIPDTEPKAVINFIHGIGEHTSRYKDWFPFFVEAGFAVFAIEYRGHGRSFGKRGHLKDDNDLLNDIDILLEKSKEKYPQLPHILYGHSLGGGLVTHYTIKRQPEIKALIVSSPWFSLTQEPPSWQVSVVRFLHKYIPGLIIPTNIKAKDITHNQGIVKAYKEDKMVHNKISLKLFLFAFDNGKWNIDHANEISVPCLVLHGSSDNITNPKGSEAFYNNNPKNIHLKIWDNMFHELHNEPIRQEHAQYIIDWVEKQL